MIRLMGSGGAALSTGLLALACGSADQRTPAVGPTVGTEVAVAAASPEVRVVDEEALEIVRQGLAFLEAQSSVSVTIEGSHDTVQEGGEKLEFGSTRRVVLRRPDRLRVEQEPREGGRRIVQFNGRDLTVYDPGANAYAQLGREGDLDATIDFLRNDLAIPLPLAELLRNRPSGVLENVVTAYRIAAENVDGKPCEHIFLRNPRVDAQFWLAKGEPPVLVRAVLLYRDEEGQPEFRAELSDWQFGIDAPDELFTFLPPPGTERILFAVAPAVAQTEIPR